MISRNEIFLVRLNRLRQTLLLFQSPKRQRGELDPTGNEANDNRRQRHESQRQTFLGILRFKTHSKKLLITPTSRAEVSCYRRRRSESEVFGGKSQKLRLGGAVERPIPVNVGVDGKIGSEFFQVGRTVAQ